MPARTPAATSTQEQFLLDALSASQAQQDSARINQESHYASTPGDYHIAMWMRDELAKAGFHASLESFTHDVPFAQKLQLEMLEGKRKPERFVLDETPIPQDPDGSRRDAGPPFNAWSGSGTVAQTIVDAGYGLESDYRRLAADHIDVRTRIVLVRYGKEFRGSLAQRAQAHGARGVLFFNDPSDREGSRSGPAYPDGPYRPDGSIQRGSLAINTVTIPTLPISATNAERIIRDMHNGMTKHVYRLAVLMKTKRNAMMWNTVGILRGKDPTHMVVLGAHRDAWVYGVSDNGSGTSILLDAARALGYLYKSGWRPQYSIIIVGFDAEEIGELGSEAYVHAHAGTLEAGCLAYVNEDEATTGQRFGAMAAAAIENMIPSVVQTVRNPRDESTTLFYRWQHQPQHARISGPGGGSDFEAFLYDLGVPVLSYEFGGVFGVYHSAFDDLRYASTQADPGFVNHRAVARLAAITAFRLASGSVGYTFSPYVAPMNRALDALAQSLNRHDDLAPVRAALERFAQRAAAIDRHGGDGNQEIAVSRRLDKLLYGRNGYAPVAFPDLATALTSGNDAAISAAAGRTTHELDEISGALAKAMRR